MTPWEQVAPDGGILVAGGTQGDLDGNTNAGGHDIFIMKLDASGSPAALTSALGPNRSFTGAWSWTVLRGSSLDEVARDMQAPDRDQGFKESCVPRLQECGKLGENSPGIPGCCS